MPPFRFHIPFFSKLGSPSRLSSGTSSPSPSPPATPSPSRPPFRPGGIAQPSKPETKPKVSPSLSRVKSNVSGIAASSSSSHQSPSRGAATPTRLAKQSNQSGSPLKKPEYLRTEDQNVTMKEKPSRESDKEKPPIARPERKEGQEQRTKTEAGRLAVQERKKDLNKDMEEKSEESQEHRKREQVEKLAVQESKTALHEGGQERIKEKEILASQETKRALQAVGREDATQSKTTRHICAASESIKDPRDLPETETRNRTEIHTDDNNQKTKGVSTGTHGNPRVMSGEGSSSMSRRIKEDIRDGISKLTWGKSNGDEKSVSVYTLTGENKGATMGIASDKDKKDGEVHIRRGYRSNPDESPNTTAVETEGERKTLKGKNPKNEDEEEKEETMVRVYVNGNAQGVNNSIVLDSSVSENDPGIHMSLKFQESNKEIINPPEEKKPETEKLKHVPRVRRRCLRGLLAESSESETKPRRHGCRFTCKDKDIENNT